MRDDPRISVKLFRSTCVSFRRKTGSYSLPRNKFRFSISCFFLFQTCVQSGAPQASIRPLHYVSKRASYIYFFSLSFPSLKFWNNRMWIYSVPVHTGQLLCQASKTGPYYYFSLSCWCRVVAATPAIFCAECLLNDRMRSRGHLMVKRVCVLSCFCGNIPQYSTAKWSSPAPTFVTESLTYITRSCMLITSLNMLL